MLLRYEGWPCRLMGAWVPSLVAAAAASASDAAAVVVVSQLATGRRAAVESLRATRRAGLPVFCAGHSFVAARSRVGVPGDYLGSRIQDAAAQIISALKADDPPS